jgi:hypothetical protein
MTRIIRNLALALMLGGLLLPAARAADTATVNITLKDNRFTPTEPHAPANKVLNIVVKNLNAVPAEFESSELRVEKVVTAGGTISLRVRALTPGRYRFFDDFHPSTEGHLVVQ